MHVKDYLLLFFSLCLVVGEARAQTVYGAVRDFETGSALAEVQVINLRTDSFTLSNALGIYRIEARKGDQLRFEKPGYTTITYLVTVSGSTRFKKDQALRKNAYTLEEITVYSGLNARQRDSVQEREIYNQKVEREQAKARLGNSTLGSGTGVTLEGPFSALIEKWSPKYKRLRRFQEQFREAEKRKWIEERYTLDRISRITGLQSDSLIAFRNQHPMPYDMAAYGSELEVDNWILSCYRKWKQAPFVPALPADIWQRSNRSE